MNSGYSVWLENLKKDKRRWDRISKELEHAIRALYASKNFLKVRDVIQELQAKKYRYTVLGDLSWRHLVFLLPDLLAEKSWSLWTSESTRFSRNGVWVRLGA